MQENPESSESDKDTPPDIFKLHDISQLRSHVQALLKRQMTSVPDMSPHSWENILTMELLLHIYDGLDMMDTRILAIQNTLTRLHIIGQDTKGEGETPVP